MKKEYRAIIIMLAFVLVMVGYMWINQVQASSQNITDGIYEIEVGTDDKKAIDVIDAKRISGGNVQIFTKNNGDCQKIKIEQQQDGYYTLTFMHSNMLLDVANGKTANHTNVWQCNKHNSDAQKWMIKDLGDRIL